MNNNIRSEWMYYLSRINWNLHIVIDLSPNTTNKILLKLVKLLNLFQQKRFNKTTTLANQFCCFFILVRGTLQNHIHLLISIQYHKLKYIDLLIDKFKKFFLKNGLKINFIRVLRNPSESNIIVKYIIKQTNFDMKNYDPNMFFGNIEKCIKEKKYLDFSKNLCYNDEQDLKLNFYEIWKVKNA